LKLKVDVLMLNKHYRKPKWQSRIDNPETLATLGTQYTGRRETKYRNRTQHGKDEQHGSHQNPDEIM
jgi:hypothetical protein